MDKKLIYIADDEINICNIIKSFLLKEGFDVEIFTNGRDILEAFNRRQADMLIIDIMMPEIDGYALCSLIRLKSCVPIIIVSAKDTESDKITGLKLGGDDYLTKPFSPLELIARMNSIFRRIDLDKAPIQNNQIMKLLDVLINLNTKKAEVNGSPLALTVMELSLLNYLIQNKNRAVSRTELLDKIWGFDNKVETRATDDMIKRIRKKLTSANSKLKIQTIWGFGFSIQDND
ncbi:DNA-binding response OmpR family regulator [Clostridium saccharoperbutylacetonicum]|uniref:Stage 0 sporulation protein A homolog n=1 Tax=Clostridium saccharoperbutylacetonicum N1-4(HMT) TaxID=931276 RepID=M1MSD6_9CLOT|nr:response regulator transcription factor [Clostridium saccharoperbutylacetonicum]AGF59063.1 response regulator [Clostridium saccharoperbutylacetonicum N1-4(HMT)]NRT60149.1 DNA-binding response OmpR family regulator [Clostridium saccharoperbutylacetonicum]NSB23461.1 DNA-binding response OmpR family regulator [Clostridium saccharoperbutylacetonicum]NSB42831.1 DNA-binding response OmpR family regulator [Clostridium saccharoperbutylacetonicum]